ncbi:hypothetical protein VZC37_06495 [Gordonia sp. LSe1-13]|uniref:Uncharacterized protein n=1 Tax=Gordonia sesuvii TaxID=3116777 RepID=A0ABU7MA38_9ACTN|nr:hypothetical protein [Gordonia sp. LSe1-13]
MSANYREQLPDEILRALKTPKSENSKLIPAVEKVLARRARTGSPNPPTRSGNPHLTPEEQEQEARDRGTYETLDEAFDDWHKAHGWNMPPAVRQRIIADHKAHLAQRIALRRQTP